MINYCTHYNAFVERQADLDVQSGRYSEARKAYQLLRRYRPGEGSSEPYSKKLELLDRLEELEDPGTILEEFMKLSVRHAPQLYLEPLEDVWAVTVTNLMDMTLLPP